MKLVHAMVELEAETGKIVADPLYGLWCSRPDGGYYDNKELRQSPFILQDYIQSLLHERSGSGNLNKPLGGESATVDALTGR
jgi:hypothetical protein